MGGNTIPRNAYVTFKAQETFVYLTTAQSDGVTFGGIDFTCFLNNVQLFRSGSSTQAYGHDELAGLYNNYRVDSTRYKVEVIGDNNVVPATFIVQCNNATTSGGDYNRVIMQPWTQSKTVASVNGGRGSVVFKGKVPIHRLFGVTKSMYRDDQTGYSGILSTTSGTVPINTAVLRIAGTSTQVGRFIMRVTMWYHTKLWNVDMLANSS